MPSSKKRSTSPAPASLESSGGAVATPAVDSPLGAVAALADYPTIEDVIGQTPLVRLQRLPGAAGAARGNVILGKLEGNNPAGSVKDRPAMSMIRRAEERGDISPGDTLIEATSGNTGIALAMAAALATLAGIFPKVAS